MLYEAFGLFLVLHVIILIKAFHHFDRRLDKIAYNQKEAIRLLSDIFSKYVDGLSTEDLCDKMDELTSRILKDPEGR